MWVIGLAYIIIRLIVETSKCDKDNEYITKSINYKGVNGHLDKNGYTWIYPDGKRG